MFHVEQYKMFHVEQYKMFHVEQYKMFHVEQCKINVPRETMQNVSRGTMHKKGSCFGGRGRGFGISGLRQLLWGQGARLRHLRSPSAALQAAAVALRRRSHCPLPPKQLPFLCIVPRETFCIVSRGTFILHCST